MSRARDRLGGALRLRSAGERGYSLIELMVAIVIALFLIGGVLIVEQSVHTSYTDRSGLSQLDDDERFTMTLLTEIAQAAGYYPDPATTSMVTALPAQVTTAGNGDALNFQSGQSFYGLHNPAASGNEDTIAVRYMTASNDGIPLCDGTTNTTGNNTVYTNYFYLSGGDLYCDLEVGNTWNAPVQLVNNVEYMQIWYGLHTTAAMGSDYTVDTYVPAGSMTAGDWPEVTTVKLQVTFTNPLQAEQGQTAVTFTKVIAVMSRTGALSQ